MPQIREYENQAGLTARLDPGAAVAGGNAGLRAAQARAEATKDIGNIAVSAAGYGKAWEEQRAKEEISQGFATEAELNDNISTAWNNYVKNADPNDPTTADRFRKEELEPILQSFQTGFTTERGKAWSETRIAALRQHYFERTIGDQSRLAGVAAVTNFEKSANIWQATLQRDPSFLPVVLGSIDSMVEATMASNPNWTPEQIANFRGKIVPALRTASTMAAGGAMAKLNPAEFKKALAAGWGGTDIDGQQREQLLADAERMEAAAEADAKAASAERIRQEKAAGNANLVRIYAAGLNPETGDWNVPPDAVTAITEDAIRNPGRYDPGEVASFVNAIGRAAEEAASGENTPSDPATYDSLGKRIGKGLTKTEVDQAFYSRRLSKRDWTFLRTAAEGSGGDAEDAKIPGWSRLNEQINEHFSGVRSSITKSNAFSTQVYPAQDQRMLEYQQMVRQTVMDGIKNRGMSADEASERWLNPNSPNYLGKLIPHYQVSQEQLRTMRRPGQTPQALPAVDPRDILRTEQAKDAAKGSSPPRPGESVAQWKARTGQ